MTLEQFLRSLDWKTTGKWTILSVAVGLIAGVGGAVLLI